MAPSPTPASSPAPTQFDWPTFWLKLKLTLTSRKFWVFASSTAAIWFAYSAGGMTLALAVQAQIAAGAVYAGALALEDGLSAKPAAPQLTADALAPLVERQSNGDLRSLPAMDPGAPKGQ